MLSIVKKVKSAHREKKDGNPLIVPGEMNLFHYQSMKLKKRFLEILTKSQFNLRDTASDGTTVILGKKLPLIEHMTVESNLMGPLLWRQKLSCKKASEEIHELIMATGIRLFVHHTVDSLPQDQKLVVSLLQAILQQASTIILDDPTKGLDDFQAMKIFSICKKIPLKHSTLVLVTNDSRLSWNLPLIRVLPF